MSFITHVTTAVPPNVVEQATAAEIVIRSLQLDNGRAQALRELFEHASVARRFSVLPRDALSAPRSLSENMHLYRTHAVALAAEVARSCLSQSGVSPQSLDMVITSSCTGVLLPSIAAVLVDELGLRPDVRRLPMTEMGCAGGASALARAHEFTRAFPGSKALVIAVELPSLTLQRDDASGANLIASAIFGDGAAAALVQGRPSSPHALELVATRTQMLPRSLDDMGFDLRDGGLHVVLSKFVPSVIAEHAPAAIDDFLTQSALSRQDLRFFVLHPGGRKVLESLERGLDLPRGATSASWDVLRDYGNQSSASVLFVLERTLRQGVPSGYGLLAAFGPGITIELSLLKSLPC